MAHHVKLTVSPAYGRDYTSAKQARQAWEDGDDFIIQGMYEVEPGVWCGGGQYVSQADVSGQPYTLHLRYASMRKVIIVTGK